VILGVDTDVLVSWFMAGSPRHAAARELIQREIRDKDGLLGVTPQVVYEFLHVVTDPRRFEVPLPMPLALRIARSLWESDEVVQIHPRSEVLPRTLELMNSLRLGRKRTLDTALAATLESAKVGRLATLNPGDFRVFPFLEIVEIPAV
jgi:predicted nucleic acid-binding protein